MNPAQELRLTVADLALGGGVSDNTLGAGLHASRVYVARLALVRAAWNQLSLYRVHKLNYPVAGDVRFVDIMYVYASF